MSILTAIKEKQKKHPNPAIIDADYLRCTEDNMVEFYAMIKNNIPEIIPLISELIKAGMMDGLRSVSYKENK